MEATVDYLSATDITYVESISFFGKKELVLETLAREGKVKVRCLDILCFNMSNDWSDMDDDEITVVEVSHEYRKLQEKDLQRYSYAWDEEQSGTYFHIIVIHGDAVLEIICGSVDIEKTDTI